MEEKILRKLFLGFVQVHILYHARKEPFFGLWMIEELRRHGYQVSAGTLYPLLHDMEANGLLRKEKRVTGGKVRKYYSITEKGNRVFKKARSKTIELFEEIKDF